MSQLKMYWIPGNPLVDITLPAGYSVSVYQGDEDRMAWVECCKNGLVADDAGEEAFIRAIERHRDTVAERDVMFLDYQGRHVGTITPIFHPEENTGEMHMVAVHRDFRGKGLGKILNLMALHRLAPLKPRYIYLTTDSWRMAAVKSYLTAGFKPVDYAENNMVDRWKEALTSVGMAQVDMLDSEGKFICTLRAYDVENRKRLQGDEKVRVGVFGAGRGKTMANFCKLTGEAELVAVCDQYAPALESAKAQYGGSVRFHHDFEAFLNEDMDMVVLANYANEHAPYAIRCLEAGKHVLSEVLPAENMQQCVALVEAVEKSGLVYGYAENYCYMNAPRAMKEMYRSGKLGTFEYGEGEYMHNCEPGWHRYTKGDPGHWRNTMYATYYCTHSIGPLLHITGLRPVRVTGFELPFNARMMRMGAKAGLAGIEMIELENGAYLKSIHGVGPSRNSVWYSIYGSKGRLESAREDAGMGGERKLYINVDGEPWQMIEPASEAGAANMGHSGSDYYTMHHFISKLRGDADADIVDVYEAMDMFLPGLFAYRSIIHENQPMEIPNLRSQEARDAWREDTWCTNPAIAGDQWVPSYSKGNPAIPDEVYAKLREAFQGAESVNPKS